jgi:serine/arginine repetitive matrix protein 2
LPRWPWFAGIGLLSVRGSGTSGYVQTNRFNLRGPPQTQFRDRDDDRGPVQKKPNEEILEHNRKRQIELEVETMRAQLEDEE